MPYATRDGVKLFYEREGSAEPPLLFVHGWCCDHTFFAPQFDYFKSSRTVVAVDLRGCGRSDRPEAGYDIPTLADDLAWLANSIGISRPIVVGHSLGGMVAIELAARHPSVPLAIMARSTHYRRRGESLRTLRSTSMAPTARLFGARGSRTRQARPWTPTEGTGSSRRCARFH